MATLILSYAGAAVGGMIGGPFGAVAGRAVGGMIGGRIDGAILSGLAPTGTSATLPSADAGGAIPRVYGRIKVSGQLIWATAYTSRRVGGKGTRQSARKQKLFANFAMALCEGPIARVGRIWADGKLLRKNRYTIKVYRGDHDQPPDDLIAAKQGTDSTPAYRDTAYVVFDALPVTRFGNRLPLLEFEVVRLTGKLEQQLTAVSIIPGATEFGYHTALVSDTSHPGATRRLNRSSHEDAIDFPAAIEDLMSLCPNLSRVALVITWFGDDLRCGHGTLRPKVESKVLETQPEWLAAGLSRDDALAASRFDSRPAYGGSPGDAAVVAAIKHLKSCGLAVTLYPFIMMDIPADNQLVDPVTQQAGQPAHPWRGRITCDPAPGVVGTVDGTTAAADQISRFVGTITSSDITVSDGRVQCRNRAEWSYRRMMFHLAALAQLAGGVDAFLIGSELRGLTRVRDAAGEYPFVAALGDLAQELRAVFGDAVKLSYAADWSEYGSYVVQDSSGDVDFPLDSLWANTAIAAISIDYYMPLSDWREHAGQADSSEAVDGHDLDYLRGNLRSGEGYDWFYASGADRSAQARTPITDGQGSPWVFRSKDMWSWWSNRHYPRIAGVPSAQSTAWSPKSKPIWLTEFGCPAVHNGAHQPNIFPDPKSAESGLPHGSNGRSDPLIQRRYLDAILTAFDPRLPGFDPIYNPPASGYVGRMIDPEHLYAWAWDVRPYPAFPADQTRWADAVNWATGHWLNGRLGQSDLDEVVAAILADHHVLGYDTRALKGSIAGYVRAQIEPARNAVMPLAELFQFALDETPEGLVGRPMHRAPNFSLPAELAVRPQQNGSLAKTDLASDSRPSGLTVRYVNHRRGFEQAAGFAGSLSAGINRQATLDIPAALTPTGVSRLARRWLEANQVSTRSLEVTLPPDQTAPSVGDVFDFEYGENTERYRIEEIVSGTDVRVTARRVLNQNNPNSIEAETAEDAWILEDDPDPAPLAIMMDLPLDDVGASPHLAIFADPWPGTIATYRQQGDGLVHRQETDEQSTIGQLGAAIGAGPTTRWDRASRVNVRLLGGALYSESPDRVLNGANMAAIKSNADSWEIIQFASAELIAPQTYQLTNLIRGRFGTEDATAAGAAVGSWFVLLDETVNPVGLAPGELGGLTDWIAVPEDSGEDDAAAYRFQFTAGGRGLLPLSPCHVRARRTADGNFLLSWIRRSRTDRDHWDLVDVQLAEDRELYQVDVRAVDDSTPVRSWQTATPTTLYSATAFAADFPQPPLTFLIDIQQIGALPGIKRTGVINV